MQPKLSDLHEAFIDQANRPMKFGNNPIAAKEPVPVIVPSNRWEKIEGKLTKSFKFRTGEHRSMFVAELLEYEEHVQHHADMRITEGSVSLKLVTKGIDEITERDREYANFADSVYKDIVYSP